MRRLWLAAGAALLITGCSGISDTGAGGDTNAVGFRSGVAFTRDGDIFVADQSDFENKVQRLTTDGNNGQPALSRDGKAVAFVHTDPVGGTQELRSVPSGGGTPAVLLAAQGRSYRGLAWSPDGGRVYFAHSAGGSSYAVSQVNANGSGEAVISPSGPSLEFPSVASDGTVWAVDADGAGFVRLSGGAATPGFSGGGAQSVVRGAVSPDGSRVAFEDASTHEIWVAPSGGGAATQLTQIAGGQQREPTWSSDGSSIVFVSNAGGGDKLYRAPSNGSKVTGSLVQVGSQPSWGG